MNKRGKGGKPEFWQFARDFLHDYCTHTRRMSPKTIEAYRIGIENFISFLLTLGINRQQITFDKFDHLTVKEYSTWMTTVNNYSPKTIDLRLTILKSFLKFSAWQDPELMALYEKVATIKPPKNPKKPVEHLTPAATAAILGAWGSSSEKARRNRMLLILLYDSAARVSEIADATLSDLHLAKPAFISLTGKGGKTRNMPLMNITVDHLRQYLDEFHPNRKKDISAPLFYSQHNGIPTSLTTDSIANILKLAAIKASDNCAEIPQRVHCHLMRKTRAMDLYTDGVPLPLIMQMLGHEAMTTTSTFYAFATEKMMTDAIATANPQVIGEPANWKDQTIMDALYRL